MPISNGFYSLTGSVDLSVLENRVVDLESLTQQQNTEIESLKNQSGSGSLSSAEQTLITPLMDAQSSFLFSFNPGKSFILQAVSFTAIARVRLYRNAEFRSLDTSRNFGVNPSGEHGLILDLIPNFGNSYWNLSPLAFGANADDPKSNICYGVIENKNNESLEIAVTFFYTILEA